MGIGDAVIKAEREFAGTFAEAEQRDWGTLFFTPDIPESQDGNHAWVRPGAPDVDRVAAEINEFYTSRGLTPLVYYVSAESDWPELRGALTRAGFAITNENAARMYLRRNPSRITPNPAVQARCVGSVDEEMFSALTSVCNRRMAAVVQRRAANKDAWLFVGELNGQAASVALLEQLGDVCRVDEVHTSDRYRRRGAARAVVNALVAWHQEHLSAPLYLWTDNPTAERIYREAGFVRMDIAFTSWCAWR